MFARHKYLSCVATAAMGFLLSPGATWAQSQSDSAQSVAEAARRAREQKKEKPKPARTFTNDDIPPTSPGIAGKEPAEANGAIKPSPEESAAVGKKDTEEKAPAPANDEQSKQKKAENAAALERAKKLLAQSESELDVMQREYRLRAAAFYADAGNRLRNQQQWSQDDQQYRPVCGRWLVIAAVCHVAGQRRGDQRARRPPGSVDRGTLAARQSRTHVCEPVGHPHHVDQIAQVRNRLRFRRRHDVRSRWPHDHLPGRAVA